MYHLLDDEGIRAPLFNKWYIHSNCAIGDGPATNFQSEKTKKELYNRYHYTQNTYK